jgi:hypothetical protein
VVDVVDEMDYIKDKQRRLTRQEGSGIHVERKEKRYTEGEVGT